MPWRFIPRECLSYLSSDPFGGRIGGDTYSDQPPSQVAENHQTVELNLNEIERITNKSMDAPAVWLLRKVFQLCEGGRPHLSIYLRPSTERPRSPASATHRVFVALPIADSLDSGVESGLGFLDRSLSPTEPPRAPVPIGSEVASMSADYGLRLHHRDRIQNGGNGSVKPDQDQSIEVA